MIHVFYHSVDLDGISSAAIVYNYFVSQEVKIHPINHGMSFPFDEIERHDQVYMVDFGLESMDDMNKLKHSCHFIWIDHHISAINKAKDYGLEVAGIQEVGKAGCELVWQYLYESKPPKIITMLGRYDVWDLAYSEDLLPLQFGMKMLGLKPEDKDWPKLFENNFEVNRIIENGRLIQEYQKKINKEACKKACCECEYQGYKAIAMNSFIANSGVFEGFYDPAKHDIMIVYCWGAEIGLWYVSLYTENDDINVSELALARGGGGHKKAAGFQTDSVAEFTKKR